MVITMPHAKPTPAPAPAPQMVPVQVRIYFADSPFYFFDIQRVSECMVQVQREFATHIFTFSTKGELTL